MSYQEDVDHFTWKYKFYYVTDNQITDCKIVSSYTQFKNLALSLKILKKTKRYRIVIEIQDTNIVSSMNWKLNLFDFDSHYRDQNLIFVYNKKRNKSLTNEIFVKIGNIINDDYLRYAKNININAIFNEWAAKTDNNKVNIIKN